MPAERKGVPYPAVAMVIIAILSVQLGSALATDLFDELGVGGVVFMRALVSAIVLMIIWRPNLRLRREDIPVTLMFGVALAGMNLAFYESIDRIPLGTAVTIEFIGPLSVALITSHRRKDLIWVAMAATGILLLTGGIGGDDLDVAGILLAVLAGILWGSYIVLGKGMGEQYGGSGTGDRDGGLDRPDAAFRLRRGPLGPRPAGGAAPNRLRRHPQLGLPVLAGDGGDAKAALQRVRRIHD